MPNLDGLSEEEKRRQLAASEKTKGDFAKAHDGVKPRAPEAARNGSHRAHSTMNHVLTPGGQTRVEKTAAGQQREDRARAIAEQRKVRAAKQTSHQQKRANLRKEFSMAHNHQLENDGPEL